MPGKRAKRKTENKLTELLGPDALKLLSGTGPDLIRKVGIDVIRDILLDILTGKNLRDSTEVLTRSRIAALNMALVQLFLKGAADSEDFVQSLPSLATDILKQRRLAKSERWLASWMLGLTDKSIQNVLRDSFAALDDYRQTYVDACNAIMNRNKLLYGELEGFLRLNNALEAKVDWLFMLYLLDAVGAQTLAIRGSEKSAYGKLFEKLVLGSLLSILDFTYESSKGIGSRIFWLSTQDEKRESDATLLYEIGQGGALRYRIYRARQPRNSPG